MLPFVSFKPQHALVSFAAVTNAPLHPATRFDLARTGGITNGTAVLNSERSCERVTVGLSCTGLRSRCTPGCRVSGPDDCQGRPIVSGPTQP